MKSSRYTYELQNWIQTSIVIFSMTTLTLFQYAFFISIMPMQALLCLVQFYGRNYYFNVFNTALYLFLFP